MEAGDIFDYLITSDQQFNYFRLFFFRAFISCFNYCKSPAQAPLALPPPAPLAPEAVTDLSAGITT